MTPETTIAESCTSTSSVPPARLIARGGRRITIAEALKSAQSVLEQAEASRLKAAEDEASRMLDMEEDS